MARPRTLDRGEQFNVRIPHDLVQRIDRHLERMRRALPGLGLSRSDVFRTALGRGLDALEAEAGAGARGKR
jgi:hypothetical protein